MINITGGDDLTLFEIDEVVHKVKSEVDEKANVIFGSTFNDEIENKLKIQPKIRPRIH